MYAVIDSRGDDLPDVYVFNDRDKALEFVDWLIDTDPASDGTEDFHESAHQEIVVVEASVPPVHWGQSL